MIKYNRKAWMKAYRLRNKEKFNEYSKAYRLRNKEKVGKYQKEYRLKNKKKLQAYEKRRGTEYRLKNKEYYIQYRLSHKAQRREYLIKNKEHIKKKNKEYVSKNKDYWLQWSREYKKNRSPEAKEVHNKWKRTYRKMRCENDPSFKLRQRLASRIWGALSGAHKSAHTMELIGCTVEELWIHLESQFKRGMTRGNYGIWHCDHIKACAKFDLTDPEQQRICFHWTNLQPLWATDNIKKGAR